MQNKEILKQIAYKYNKDARVIDLVTKHPFKFSRDVMSDPEDYRAIMITYFGKFVQKKTKNKKRYYEALQILMLTELMCYK